MVKDKFLLPLSTLAFQDLTHGVACEAQNTLSDDFQEDPLGSNEHGNRDCLTSEVLPTDDVSEPPQDSDDLVPDDDSEDDEDTLDSIQGLR
jgi:hypothetical protein